MKMSHQEKLFIEMTIVNEIGNLKSSIPYCDKLKPILKRIEWFTKLLEKVERL